MAIIKTKKHELTYDDKTKQGIFNKRNKTAYVPEHDPFPARLVNITALPKPTGLTLTGKIIYWTAVKGATSYNIYLNDELVGTTTTSSYALDDDIVVGTDVVGISALSDDAIESDKATMSFTVYSITATVTNGSYSGDNKVIAGQTTSGTITVNEGYDIPTSITVVGATSDYSSSTGIILLSDATGNVTISAECPSANYVIGFTGMSQSTPALTRTDAAVGASVTDTNGVIEVTGLDMSKIWGGYIGNDGETLTWDGTNFLKDGVAYTGNVFSKINRFFCKPIYVDSVLDGYQLIYANTQPEGTEDWFYGKDYVGIGCYKARGSSYPMVSVKGTSQASTSANFLVTAYKTATTTSGNLHEKWFNENAIMQVLFMTVFATRQTEDVFQQGTYRNNNDSKQTGFMDSMRTSSAIATGYTTSYGSGKDGNMFLGIEDFIGFGYELVAGVKLSRTNVQTTRDFANFSYSETYDSADVNLASITSGQYIKSLQQSESVIGLLIPKEGTGDTSTATTYFCDRCWTNENCWYQGASDPDASRGVFFFLGNNNASTGDSRFAGRLCRTPA